MIAIGIGIAIGIVIAIAIVIAVVIAILIAIESVKGIGIESKRRGIDRERKLQKGTTLPSVSLHKSEYLIEILNI